MIEKVELYQTKDHVLHHSRTDATVHIITQLENAIGPIVDTTGIGIKDRRAIVGALIGTLDRAREVQKILNNYL